MLKGVLNKGVVKYSLGLVVLVLCVISLVLYVKPTLGKLSETGFATGAGGSGSNLEIMNFQETDGTPNDEGMQAPPQAPETTSNGDSTPSETPPAPQVKSGSSFVMGGSSGGSGGASVQCVPQHMVCDYAQKACVLVNGAGTDECSNFNQCVHSECNMEKGICTTVNSKGENTCSNNQDCISNCTPPYIQVDKTALPAEATCQDTAINLKVEGKGDTCGQFYPVDVVIVFDKSGSMDDDGWDGTISDWQPIGDAKIAAKTFADLLKANDKAGLVSFSTTATLDQTLTFDKQAVKDKITAISAGGWTNMSQALELANLELMSDGRPEVKWIEVLLSDGNNNCGVNNPPSDCQNKVYVKANEAKSVGIVVYTIALGQNSNQTLMKDVADITGGDFYYAPDSSDLQAIYEDIAKHVTTIAGSDVFVYDYLPTYVELNQSTLPSECYYNALERKITCGLNIININETATIEFDVSVKQLGHNLANVYPDSGVSYRDHNSTTQFISFPETYVTVHGYQGAEEICNDTYDNDCDGLIDWNDTDCRHDICNYNMFTCDNLPKNIQGDACEASSECYHMECADMTCTKVAGEGQNSCAENADCYYMHCDYQQQACTPAAGNQNDECSTYNDCQFCGNGRVDGSEQCELPSTQNNQYCSQTTQECLGNKIGIRDAQGNCSSGCSCTYDSFTYSCVKDQCDATCDSNDDCTCGQDGCVGLDYYDYPAQGTCTDGCTCDQGSCTPSISYNDQRCSHKVCDYQLQACSLVEDAGTNECSTWNDCQFCGNERIDGSEQCELPDTQNNQYCVQTTQNCSGNMLGTRDALGDCNEGCGCNYDQFTYSCVKDQCGAQCDDNSDCADYCDGSVKHTGRTCNASSTCTCSIGNTFDCNSLDGWYNTTNKQWVSTGVCTEKEQLKQEYRNYVCGVSPAVDCYYSVTETKWVDTGQTRNKADGTSCNDGLWCTDNDMCTAGICGGNTKSCSDEIICTDDSCDEVHDTCVNMPDDTHCDDGLWCNGQETCDAEEDCIGGMPVDCSENNINEIATCDNNPDNIHYTWDYGTGFVSQCDENNDMCTNGTQTLTHTCSVESCQAECDSTHGCANSTCSQTYNDYCTGVKLTEYNTDKVMDSTDVNNSTSNTCLDSCLCTDNPVSCNPPQTNTYCVKDVCGAECDSNDDCNDENPHTLDSCDLSSCGCKHDYVPYCGDGIIDNGEECETSGYYAGWGHFGHEYTCNEDNTYRRCIDCQYEHVNECNYYCSANLACNGTAPMTYLNSCTQFGQSYLQDYCNENCKLEDDNCESDYYGCTAEPECDELVPNTGDCNYMCEYKPAPFCGDGIITGNETCELPGSYNNFWCPQGKTECSSGKLGTRDGYGDCNSACGCNYDNYTYSCVKDQCGAQCDDNSDCADYCNGSVKHTGRTCNASSTCACSAGTTFNCNSLDGWYNTTDKQWVSTGACTEKEQLKQEYRDYNCGVSPAVDCYYSVTETKWVDTGQTRNKADGTSCNDGLWCMTGDVCTSGICGGSTRDCSYNNIPLIARCDNNPDSNPYTWDYGDAFISTCDEVNDRCTTGTQNLTHTCSVESCQAECDSTHGCANSTCSQTYNDYCNGKKLVEYDSDKILDSTTVTGSAQNTCIYESCLCTKNNATCNPPSTNTYCVKGVCDAGCSTSSDCTCGQQDGCVGIDYYDYPDYSTCRSDCTCQECIPTISECDSRCVGNCKVEVKLGHDMNPRWGYPYTATDDMWIMATDISNGACNGLTVDITYWWCSCPSQTPLQSSIEVTQSEWSAKYDRLCSADAANYGGTNPTHSLECADCGVSMYHPSFPADSSKKFWTGIGSCGGTFQIDLRPGCYDIEYVPALACAGQCEDHPIIKHAECINMQCVAVDGAGTDQCTTDADCYYNACDWTNMICVKTAGNLADECASNADCATHYECTDVYTCERVSGAGTNQCNPAKPTSCGGFDDPRIQPEM
jgi:hypothetical protein